MIKLGRGLPVLVVTGASGRIGQMLRAVWGGAGIGAQVLWAARKADQDIDIVWDIGREPVPDLPRKAIFLHLAGQTTGRADKLAENRQSVEALCKTAVERDAAHVFFMSSVAVYRPQAALIDETVMPDPVSDYGRAKLAAETAARGFPAGTLLRLGNLAGADSLLTAARRGPVTLDPIDGQSHGPERSYIGPHALAAALQALIAKAARAEPLPSIVNLAQHPALGMADLLDAAGAAWRFGPPNPSAIPRVAVDTQLLSGLVPLPPASARGIIADLDRLRGVWPQ